MKKQKGFTLIELMVVMAIIAILATAGLSAYTGYIKKARDATRIADISALNAIIISAFSSTGNPPSESEFENLVTSMNNGIMMKDPLWDKGNICYYMYNSSYPSGSYTPTASPCMYQYMSDGVVNTAYCPSGEYMLFAYFESVSNSGLYQAMPSNPQSKFYWVGTCTSVSV